MEVARARSTRDRNVPRLLSNAREPRTHRGCRCQVEAGFARRVRVRVKRNVSDGVTLGDKERAASEVLLHHRERGLTTLLPHCNLVRALVVQAAPELPEL